jgi:undecaprenyl-diphosphatase
MTRHFHRPHRPWATRFARLHPKAYLGLHIGGGLVLSALCAWAFYVMAEALPRRGAMVHTDHRVAQWMEMHNSETGERIALVASLFGDHILWPLVGVVTLVLLVRRAWPQAMLLACGAGGSSLLNAVLKSQIHRGRPIFAAEFNVDHSSFPSGHAMNSTVAYGLLAYLIGLRLHSQRAHAWLVVATAAVVLGIGFTRIYLDVHFLSDVLAAYAAGGLWLAVCITAFTFVRTSRLSDS